MILKLNDPVGNVTVVRAEDISTMHIPKAAGTPPANSAILIHLTSGEVIQATYAQAQAVEDAMTKYSESLG